MKRKLGVLLVVITVRLFTFSQAQHGSFIAVTSSPDEIVVAADSRTHDGTGFADNHCKISALGNKLIFAASGETGEGPLAGPPVWDANTLAHHEFHRFTAGKGAPQYSILGFAKAWGQAAEVKVQSAFNRKVFVGTVDGSHAIMDVIFAGFSDGKLSIVMANILYEGGKARFTVQGVSNEPGKQLVSGRKEVMEALQREDPTLIREIVRDSANVKPGDDITAYSAIEDVKLTIEHQTGVMVNGKRMDTVGGPIDAVIVYRSDGIKWIDRKSNCPAN